MIKYPRYELTISISERLSLDETKMIVQTTTGIPDTKDREALIASAGVLIDFALFEGWGDEER